MTCGPFELSINVCVYDFNIVEIRFALFDVFDVKESFVGWLWKSDNDVWWARGSHNYECIIINSKRNSFVRANNKKNTRGGAELYINKKLKKKKTYII